MSQPRALIVGAGLMGLSAARSLLKAGCMVTVLDQHTVPNPLGSSVDQHRLIRHPYGSHRGYTRMIDAAYAAWDRLWDDLGASHYVPTGTLVLGHEPGDWADQSAATLAALGRTVQPLSVAACRDRFPALSLDTVRSAFYVETGGVLLARRIVEALAAFVQARGADLRPQTTVRSIDPDCAAVTLADGTTLAGDLLAIAAGPWVTRLLPDLAARVTPSRQIVVYLDVPAADEPFWASAPMVLDIDPERGVYFVPPVAGTGLKLGDHRFSLTGDPDRDREATEAEATDLLRQAQRRLRRGTAYQVAQAKTCFYTVEPEERFILERQGSTWIMTGFSGHGFKFGALLGERLAEAALGRVDPDALQRWAAGEAP